MEVASVDSDLAYLATFESSIDENMLSGPLGDPALTKHGEHSSDPNGGLPSAPTEALPATAGLEEELGKHWLATTNKTHKLRDRLMQERAKIDALQVQFLARQSQGKALHDRIETSEAWLKSILDNFNVAIQDHKVARGIHSKGVLKAVISRIEQRQRAVEVALQQGPSEYVYNGQAAITEVNEQETVDQAAEVLPEDRLFRMEDADLELLELDLPFFTTREPVGARQNQPPIGMFTVPKPTKKKEVACLASKQQ